MNTPQILCRVADKSSGWEAKQLSCTRQKALRPPRRVFFRVWIVFPVVQVGDESVESRSFIVRQRSPLMHESFFAGASLNRTDALLVGAFRFRRRHRPLPITPNSTRFGT